MSNSKQDSKRKEAIKTLPIADSPPKPRTKEKSRQRDTKLRSLMISIKEDLEVHMDIYLKEELKYTLNISVKEAVKEPIAVEMKDQKEAMGNLLEMIEALVKYVKTLGSERTTMKTKSKQLKSEITTLTAKSH